MGNKKGRPKDTQFVRTKKREKVSLDKLHMKTKCPKQLGCLSRKEDIDMCHIMR
jgi:hypothetical protein